MMQNSLRFQKKFPYHFRKRDSTHPISIFLSTWHYLHEQLFLSLLATPLSPYPLLGTSSAVLIGSSRGSLGHLPFRSFRSVGLRLVKTRFCRCDVPSWQSFIFWSYKTGSLHLLVHLALLKILGLFLPIKKEETQEYQSQELFRVSTKTL